VLNGFAPAFREAFARAMLRRLGLASRGEIKDQELAGTVWRFLAGTRAPLEQFFFDWRGGGQRAGASPSAPLYAGDEFREARDVIGSYEPASDTVAAHPYFHGASPCTMLIDEMEAIWAPIAADDDWGPLHEKLEAIAGMREAYSASDRGGPWRKP